MENTAQNTHTHTPLTESQQKFVDISKEVENLKEQLKTKGEELEKLMAEIGLGTMFQDSSDGTVFEIVIPSGTFISYKTIGYERTRREGEKSGKLSLKRAQEAGFTVK